MILCRQLSVLWKHVILLEYLFVFFFALLFLPEVQGEAGINTGPQFLFSSPSVTDPVSLPSPFLTSSPIYGM